MIYYIYESISRAGTNSSRGLGAVEMAKFANRFYPEHSSKAWWPDLSRFVTHFEPFRNL